MSRNSTCLILILAAMFLLTSNRSIPQVNADTNRYVIFLHGIGTSGNQVAAAASSFKSALSADVPPNNFIYFSYAFFEGIGSARASGWIGDPLAGGAPNYSPDDTRISEIQYHTETLDWLIDQILYRAPNAEIDLIGYSLGGVVAMRWAGTQSDERRLTHVHRIVTLDSPIHGVHPTTSPWAKPYFGEMLDNLVANSTTMTQYIPRALNLIDVTSV